MIKKILSVAYCILISIWFLLVGACVLYAQDNQINSETINSENTDNPKIISKELPVNAQVTPKAPEEPIIVNGNRIEYSTETEEVNFTENVEVSYKGTKLSCQKLTLNTKTKECVAEGNVRLEDAKGIIEGEKVFYNLQNKTGTIINSGFRADPYFGKAAKVEKVSDNEFIALKGYATTCSLDKPHYRISSKEIKMFPKDKIQTKGDTFYIADIPVAYLNQFNQSLKDNMMHGRIMPGKSSDWGYYVLSAWRYNLTDNVSGRVYLDERERLGMAEGFGFNYTPPGFGKGDFKFYYTDEKPVDMPMNGPQDFQRYLVRWRHKWDIDRRTNVISEFMKISDEKRKKYDLNSNFLKDYFYREYEKDAQPLSYILFHHSFQYSGMDILFQKRVNHWFDQLEKTPELKYSLPSIQIGETPFYLQDDTSFANYNRKATGSTVETDNVTVTRFDTVNRFSLPMKVLFVDFTPFVQNRSTFYDKDANGDSLPARTIFYSGADLSTKFYRIFNVNTNLLGLDLNGVRHIITPTVGYAYNHEPTIPASKLRQIDSVDSITTNNSIALGLQNKLQTKRKGQSVDLVDFLVTSSYIIKPKTGEKRGSNLSDFLFNLKLLPYSWLRVEMDATYKHSGNRSDVGYNRFTNVNYDFYFNLGHERTIGIGQRYQLKGGNELTHDLNWRFNPKWRFHTYLRRNIGHDPTLKRGLREQEYTISRDLHCWTTDFTYNIKRGVGETVWLIFRLKAFPETEFGFDQTYHEPKPGSQSNP